MQLPIIIDVEASGFGRGSYPIEIGFVLGDGTPHCFLLAPMRSWVHWDDQAEAVHGISRRMLEDHGRPCEDVAKRMNAMLHGHKVYSDAWVYDMSWVGKLFDAVNMAPSFRLRDLGELLSESQMAHWHDAKRQAAAALDSPRHRASNDARVIQRAFRETLDVVGDEQLNQAGPVPWT